MVKKQEYRMLMVRDKIIRKMLTLYPAFSSAGIGGFCEVWYLVVGHLLSSVIIPFSRPLEAPSFLPVSPRQTL